MYGAVPGDLGGRSLARPDVVVGADIAAVEADTGAKSEHTVPGRGVDVLEEGEGYNSWGGGKGRCGRAFFFFLWRDIWEVF